jgi:hypothetical protein
MTSETKMKGKDSVVRGLASEYLLGTIGFLGRLSNSREVNVTAYWVCTKCGCKFKAQ